MTILFLKLSYPKSLIYDLSTQQQKIFRDDLRHVYYVDLILSISITQIKMFLSLYFCLSFKQNQLLTLYNKTSRGIIFRTRKIGRSSNIINLFTVYTMLHLITYYCVFKYNPGVVPNVYNLLFMRYALPFNNGRFRIRYCYGQK